MKAPNCAELFLVKSVRCVAWLVFLTVSGTLNFIREFQPAPKPSLCPENKFMVEADELLKGFS